MSKMGKCHTLWRHNESMEESPGNDLCGKFDIDDNDNDEDE